MNKGIIILILTAVLGAMGIVFFTHVRQPDTAHAPEALPDDSVKPVMPSETNGTPDFEPDAGVSPRVAADSAVPVPSLFGNEAGRDGKPAPVILTPGGASNGKRAVEAPARPAQDLGFVQEEEKKAGAVPTGSAPRNDEQERAPLPEAVEATPRTAEKSGSPGLAPLDMGKSGKSNAAAISGATKSADAGMKSAPPPPARNSSGEKSKQTELSSKGTHVLKNIGLHFAGQNMRLRIEADSAFPSKVFTLTSPDRLVIDLPGVWKGLRGPVVPQNQIVKNVRVGLQKDSARIVLDLSGPPKSHSVDRSGNVVEVLVR